MADDIASENFLDPEGYRKYGGFPNLKEIFSFKNIAMMHIKKILDLGCVEWHGGYNKETITVLSQGQEIRSQTHVDDTRMAWGNAILMFFVFTEPKMTKWHTQEHQPERAGILEAKDKCMAISRKLQTANKLAQEDYADYVEAHMQLFLLLNEYANKKNYWTMMGISE